MSLNTFWTGAVKGVSACRKYKLNVILWIHIDILCCTFSGTSFLSHPECFYRSIKVLNILSADDQIVFVDSEDSLQRVFCTLYTAVSKYNLRISEKWIKYLALEEQNIYGLKL
jgi:hypothetical protein